MCLLVVQSRPGTSVPLLVAANRDERLDRPAVAMAVLRDAGPRILGGRDLEAGGTWLAVSEDGVVAGLTNTPAPGGRDPTKRSRGELPLLAAAQPSAELAVRAVCAVRAQDYNPAWMLVGDRTSLFSVSVAGDRPAARRCQPGLEVLENRPLTPRSAKALHVLGLLARHDATDEGLSPGEAVARLAPVLADHSLPGAVPGAESEERGPGIAGWVGPPGLPGGPERAPALGAACVHTPGYGTRSSLIVVVGPDASGPPAVLVADGAPCEAPFVDRSGLWWDDAAGARAGAGGVTGGIPRPAVGPVSRRPARTRRRSPRR